MMDLLQKNFSGEWYPEEILETEIDAAGRTKLLIRFSRETGDTNCPGCEADQDYHFCQQLPETESATCTVVLDGEDAISVSPELP